MDATNTAATAATTAAAAAAAADTNNNDDTAPHGSPAAPVTTPTNQDGSRGSHSLKVGGSSASNTTHPRDYYDRRYSALQYYKQLHQQASSGSSNQQSSTDVQQHPVNQPARSSPLEDPEPSTSTHEAQSSNTLSWKQASATIEQPGGKDKDEVAEAASDCAPDPNQSSSATTENNKCKFCGKKYKELGDLQKHLVLHLDKKPYKCEECGKRFRGKSNLIFHTKAAHGLNDSAQTVSSMEGVETSMTFDPDLSQSTSANHMPASEGTVQSVTSSSSTAAANQDAKMQPTAEAEDACEAKLGNSSDNNSLQGKSNGECLAEEEAGEMGSPESSMGSVEKEVGVLSGEGDTAMTVEYPSMFPGLKHHISIKNETVLVTRLDGVNLSTGSKASLYKCHLCNKIFSYLSKLQCHMSAHYDRQMTLYQCTYCDAHFRFKTQLLQHLRCYHGTQLSPSEELPEANTDLLYQSPEANKSVSSLSISSSSSLLHGEPLTANQAAELGQGQRPVSEQEMDSKNESHTYTSPTDSSQGSRNFAKEGGLVKGIKHHRLNGLYVCQFCNRSFDRLFSLHRHERVHTGYKPCYCSYCGKGFSEPRNLRHHLIRYHSDGSQAHLLRRSRRRMVDTPSRSSQRLPLVTPDMIVKAGGSEQGSTKAASSGHRTQSTSPPDMSPQSPPNLVPQKDDLAPDDSRQAMDDNDDELEPGEVNRRDNHPILIEPREAQEEGEGPDRVANEIRQKEKLDEDVTVVIPSDAPLENKAETELHTPKSTASDNTSWSGNVSEGDTESVPYTASEIMHAPLKSIMGLHQQWRPPRRKSLSYQRGTPPAAGKEGEEQSGVVPVTPPGYPAPRTNAQSPITPPTPQDHKPPLSLAHLPSALGLPFSPLNISTLSMAGLLPSPVISPLYGQHGLGSPPMLTNPLSLYTHFPTLPTTTTTTTSLKDPHIPPPPAPPSKDHSPDDDRPPASGSSSPQDAMPGWIGSSRRSSTGTAAAAASSADNGKGVSSLSRTHSRLYVVRQPIKREDACKPTMLPNGRMVYRCTYCNKEFCTVSDVNRHMDFHEDIRPYKCKFCDYFARTNSQLKVHMMRHQGIREFHCRLCSYKGVTQSDLNRHMKSQIHMMKARNECKHCGEGFVSPMNLEKHYHEKHFSQYEHLGAGSHGGGLAGVSSVREVPPRKPRHECKLCGEGFMSPLELEKHYHDRHYAQYRQFLNQATGSGVH